MKYSIIIPVKDQFSYTKECINSIHKFSDDYEILIIDNGSNSGTRDKYGSILNNNTWIYSHSTPLGFPRAVNIGLRRSMGDYIVILNNDTVVCENWLKIMSRECLKRNALIGLIGANIEIKNGVVCHGDSYSNKVRPEQLPKEVDYCGMMCFMMTREMYNNIGHLDEGFGIGYCEDAEYGIRAKKKGYNSVVINLKDFIHYGNVTMKPTLGDIESQMAKNFKLLGSKVQLKSSVTTITPNVVDKTRKINCMVLSWETLKDTRLCIESLLKEKDHLSLYGIKLNILVVDNGSEDGTREYLQNVSGIDKVIQNETNIGISRGRNAGIDFINSNPKYKSDYIFLIDSDITVVKDSFSAMIEYMEKHPDVYNLGAFSWQVTQDHEQQTPCLIKIEKTVEGWESTPGFPCAMTQYGIFRSSLFEKCRFDTEGEFGNPGWGYEDNDFALQMQREGYKIRRFDDIIYYHNINSADRNFKARNQSNRFQERMEYLKKKWNK